MSKPQYTTIQIPTDQGVMEAITAARDQLLTEYAEQGVPVHRLSMWAAIKVVCEQYIQQTGGTGDAKVTTKR